MAPRVLFLCTGNYYRSRFAEELFNERAVREGLPHRADSCGVATERGIFNIGPISKHALAGLKSRGITPAGATRFPRQVCEEDLASAEVVIALKEAEHRPYIEDRFPAWPDRVEYWHVHDLDAAEPADALADIERLVGELIGRLKLQCRP